MIAVLLLVIIAIALVVARTRADKKENKQTQETVAKTEAPAEKWMGAFEAYDKAFNIIKKKPLFAVVTSLAMLSGYTFGMVVHGQPKPGQFYIPYEFVFLLPLALVIPAYSLAAADGKGSSLGSLYKRPLRIFGFLILAYILGELIVGVSALLLIVPAIWTLAWFLMTGFVVMDKGMSPIKALKESKRLAQNHIGKVWGILGVGILISLGFNLLAFIPVSGQYIITALSGAFSVWNSVAMAILYRWLQKNVKSVK